MPSVGSSSSNSLGRMTKRTGDGKLLLLAA